MQKQMKNANKDAAEPSKFKRLVGVTTIVTLILVNIVAISYHALISKYFKLPKECGDGKTLTKRCAAAITANIQANGKKYYEKTEKQAQAIMQDTQDMFSAMVTYVDKVWSMIRKALVSMMDFMSNIFEVIKRAFILIGTGLTMIFKSIVTFLWPAFYVVIEMIMIIVGIIKDIIIMIMLVALGLILALLVVPFIGKIIAFALFLVWLIFVIIAKMLSDKLTAAKESVQVEYPEEVKCSDHKDKATCDGAEQECIWAANKKTGLDECKDAIRPNCNNIVDEDTCNQSYNCRYVDDRCGYTTTEARVQRDKQKKEARGRNRDTVATKYEVTDHKLEDLPSLPFS